MADEWGGKASSSANDFTCSPPVVEEFQEMKLPAVALFALRALTS
jgi:hypothetical protein